MTDFERVNGPRVQKILTMLGHIETSAKSNKASPEDVSALLEPVAAKFSLSAPSAPTATPAATGRLHHTELLHLARTVPLEAAVDALAVITARIDQELFERK